METSNLILDSLDKETRSHIISVATLVTLADDELLCAANGSSRYVYFPTEGVATMTARGFDGEVADVALVSRDSAPGAEALLGPMLFGCDCRMLTSGLAYRLAHEDALYCFNAYRDFRAALLLYIQDRMAFQQQLTLCFSNHEVEGRLSRWLLIADSLSAGSALKVTHDRIAKHLAARRSTVTVIMGSLKKAGIVQYARGSVQIVDRSTLEKQACNCYAAWQKLAERRWNPKGRGKL